eukprot:12927232-Prorocentrum_lima.AAC.1
MRTLSTVPRWKTAFPVVLFAAALNGPLASAVEAPATEPAAVAHSGGWPVVAAATVLGGPTALVVV